MEEKIINKYIPATYAEGYRLFHELDIIKMLKDQKEILAANWSINEIEWKQVEQYPESGC